VHGYYCAGLEVGVGWGFEISFVLSRECDVSAWVLFSGPKTTCFGSYGHLKFDR
jgi:hypothetical protein